MLYVRNRVHDKLSAATSTYTPRRDLSLQSNGCQSYKRPHKGPAEDPLPALTAQDRLSGPDQWLWLCYLQRRKSAAHTLIDNSRQTEWDSLWCLLEDHETNRGANIWHYVVWPCANQTQRKKTKHFYMCHCRGTIGIGACSLCFTALWSILMWADIMRHSVRTAGFFLLMCAKSTCGIWFHGNVTVVPMWVSIPHKKSNPPSRS